MNYLFWISFCVAIAERHALAHTHRLSVLPQRIFISLLNTYVVRCRSIYHMTKLTFFSVFFFARRQRVEETWYSTHWHHYRNEKKKKLETQHNARFVRILKTLQTTHIAGYAFVLRRHRHCRAIRQAKHLIFIRFVPLIKAIFTHNHCHCHIFMPDDLSNVHSALNIMILMIEMCLPTCIFT